MERPYVVCHMLTSLDGKIDGAFMTHPATGPAREKYGALRPYFDCQATLYGTVTMAGSYSDGLAGELPHSEVEYLREDYVAEHDVDHYVVSVDPEGILGWQSCYIERPGRPKAHVIEVLSDAVSNDYLAYLRRAGVSYVFAGGRQMDCPLLLEKLRTQFGIERLMLAGGGLMNWSFAQEDLIDEVSIVISPVADGDRQSNSIFERADFLPPRPPAVFQLEEVQKLEGDGLWLRYRLNRQ